MKFEASTFSWSRQPPRLVFLVAAGTLQRAGVMKDDSPAAAAQESVSS